ncbi:MAG: isoaspartyl peptidase/L-asparaginase [Conexivisphaerales archaeon]
MAGKVLLHGGAGEWNISKDEEERVKDALRKAVMAGMKALKKGSAVDAVEESVASMEDSSVLNAGRGAYPNIEGDIELDAGIMDGKTLSAGAVASVRNVPNPVRLARLVMEKTQHVLLVADGAERLAKAFSLYEAFKLSTARKKRYTAEIRKFIGKKWIKDLPIAFEKHLDTVGAVAIDDEGNLAAATSTGGTAFKLPGRVGDSPIPGAGFYASNGHGAASASGVGEAIMKYLLCMKVVASLGSLASPFSVLKTEINSLRGVYGPELAGVVAIDSRGVPSVYTDTKAIAIGYGVADGSTRVDIARKEKLDELNTLLIRQIPG